MVTLFNKKFHTKLSNSQSCVEQKEIKSCFISSNAKIINRHGLRVFILFSIEFPFVGSLDGGANSTVADDVSSFL